MLYAIVETMLLRVLRVGVSQFKKIVIKQLGSQVVKAGAFCHHKTLNLIIKNRVLSDAKSVACVGIFVILGFGFGVCFTH